MAQEGERRKDVIGGVTGEEGRERIIQAPIVEGCIVAARLRELRTTCGLINTAKGEGTHSAEQA